MGRVTVHLEDTLCQLALEHICPDGRPLRPETLSAIARATINRNLRQVRDVECDSGCAEDLARYFAAWCGALSTRSWRAALIFAEAEAAVRHALVSGLVAELDRGACPLLKLPAGLAKQVASLRSLVDLRA